jgi:hypothetical protein
VGATAIIAAIDKELARLREVRSLVVQGKAGKGGAKSASAGPGKKRGKNRLSPEARARIAEAQRKRWAAARKRAKK